MRILIVMPRNMRFGPSAATAIDLSVAAAVRASRYRETTSIICEAIPLLFSDIDTITFRPPTWWRTGAVAAFVKHAVRQTNADLVIVQQHIPTAATIARNIDAPVILMRRNFTKAAHGIKRLHKLSQFAPLAGIGFVSAACKRHFLDTWPEIQKPMDVPWNGLPMAIWSPHQKKRQEIICVGRCSRDKGILEAAKAMTALVDHYPAWSARLVLAMSDNDRDYFAAIKAAIEPAGEKVVLEQNLSAFAVKQRFEHAEIALVPSRFEEPFGRVAMEALAAGCALVSSGTGGLSEVHGSHAELLPRGFGVDDVANAVRRLIDDVERRHLLNTEGRRFVEARFDSARLAVAADNFYAGVANSATRGYLPTALTARLPSVEENRRDPT